MRGQRRFWNPVEGRYYQYARPVEIVATCEGCRGRIAFRADSKPTHVRDETCGGYLVVRGEICGTITGLGACASCGRQMRKIQWPEAAYLKVDLPEGMVWAWNESYVPALLARVRGDSVKLRHLLERDWNLARFISRIPKFAVLKKNRTRILKGFQAILGEQVA